MLYHKPKPWLLRNARTLFYSFYNPYKKVYYFVCRPRVDGVKTFVMCGDAVLLVKIGYAHRAWTLPGGAIDRGETPKRAAVREVYEETGQVVSDPILIWEIDTAREYKKVKVHYFYTQADSEDIIIDDQEIVDAGWFQLSALPEPHRPFLCDEIAILKKYLYK